MTVSNSNRKLIFYTSRDKMHFICGNNYNTTDYCNVHLVCRFKHVISTSNPR